MTYTQRISLFWLVLMGLTLASWWLSTSEIAAAGAVVSYSMVSLLLLAFVKARVVYIFFMEAGVNKKIKFAFDFWCVGICSMMVAFYFL